MKNGKLVKSEQSEYIKKPRLNRTAMSLKNKSILVTGGTGSFGQKFIEFALHNFSPKKLVVFSRDELKQFDMATKFPESKYPCLRYFIGDVRDRNRLIRAFSGIDIVVHASAMKQIVAAEYNPTECIATNIIGAQNVIDAAIENGVLKKWLLYQQTRPQIP